MISLKQGRNQFLRTINSNGTFEISVPAGEYVVELYLWVDSNAPFVGWYDGAGGMTNDPDQAFQVLVENAYVYLAITLPTDAEGLLCPSGELRSSNSGRCHSVAPTPTPLPTPAPTPWPIYVATTTTEWPPLPPVKLEVRTPEVAIGIRQRAEHVQSALAQLRETLPEIAQRIASYPWIADGVERGSEFNAFRGLISLANAGYSANLIDQPWVVEGSNYPALDSLLSLASDVQELNGFMSHPTFSDGISQQDAKIAAVLYTDCDPSRLVNLMDLDSVSFTVRNIMLPLAGSVELTIIRTSRGADYTMDLLEHAVRSVEEFMGLPFPQKQIIYWIEDGVVPGGVNYGTHVAIGVNELRASKQSLLGLLAHEASHYYWRDLRRGQHWMAEGAATLIEDLTKGAEHGFQDNVPCVVARSIAELEAFRGDYGAWEYRTCPHSLGGRFFLDLFHNIDSTKFRLAFRRLYLHTKVSVPNDGCRTDFATMCQLREAYRTYADEETAPIIDKVIAR